jgi:hypothetical protein
MRVLRRRARWAAAVWIAAVHAAVPLAAQEPPAPAVQNPSPMVEHTRAHGRVPERALPGWRRTQVDAGLERSVHLFVPGHTTPAAADRLLVHFHGAAYVAEHAVAEAPPGYALAVVQLGAGSGRYEEAFRDSAALDSLLAAVHRALGHAPATLELSAYSAGHGAIRAVLREPRHFQLVAAVLLLDGLHAGYDPPRTVLHEGGRLRKEALEPFLHFAHAAVRGEKRFLITHSEVFPGTFASTTETADHLLAKLGLGRTAVLEWGPVGMQQLGRAGRGAFAVHGFAGNSAPDHTDHLHGMHDFLGRLRALERGEDAR